MLKITARSLKTSQEILWTHTAKTDDPIEAVQRAINKKYTRSCSFHKEREISSETRWIGQVFRPYAGSFTSVTSRIAIDIDPVE